MIKLKAILYALLLVYVTSNDFVSVHYKNIYQILLNKTEAFKSYKTTTAFNSPIRSNQSLYSHPSNDDEFVGPFPSWLNVKIQFGATGDGITDDTKALQAALDSLGKTDNAAKVVYLPAGTYLLSQTLNVSYKQFISIIGADPATTTIKWVGVPGGTMLTVNGVWYSRFNRITWDGSSTAGTAIGQNWDGKVEYFDTGNEYADDVFTDVGFGIKGGFSYSISFAETAIMRCKFIRNTSAGIATGNYNALDTWIWNSLFQDCRIGVTNVADHGAGNFRVYNSVFRNSTVSDIYIGNVREFSFRDNTSTNSQAFIIALYNPNPIPMVIQGNTIIDPLSNSPIQIYQQGPVSLIDNIIRSRAGATGPVILCNAPKNDADFFAVGNIFTINNPIKADKSILYDNSIVSVDSLSKLQEQKLPGAQPNLHRRVFEVPAGSGTKVLQNAINQASAEVGSRSVVHIPYGKYIIDSTLTIPAGSDVQIVGDGYSTQLAGAGRGPVMHIMGPSKATLRDVNINGNSTASGIIATDVDQIGSRVFMHELESHNNDTGMLVKGLDNTVLLMYNSGFTFSNKGIEVIGGPLAAAGTPGTGRVIMYAGCNLGNVISHKVSNGGNLLVRDYWYESNQSNQYLHISGPSTFVMEAGCANNPAVISVPQFMLNNFSGKATFLNSFITDRIAITGDGSQAKILGLGMHSYNDRYIYDSTSPAAKVQSLGSRTTDHNSNVSGSGSYSKADIGSMEVSFITEMLESVRNVHTQTLTPLADDISDLRFYRVWTGACTKGIELQGSTPKTTFFRSKSNGDYNRMNTWEYSMDSIIWVDAMTLPSNNEFANVIIQNSHTVVISDSAIVGKLTIKNGGILQVAPGAFLIVNDASGNDITVEDLGNLVIQSDSTGTGRIGNSSGTILGDVTVERYISSSNNGSYRLLSPSVNTIGSSKPFIRDNWQEGQNNTSLTINSNNIPHYGTYIKGSTIGENGFDATLTGLPSLFFYNQTSPFQVWVPIANTNATNLEAKKGYFISINGDRSNISDSNFSSNTTLRATGKILSGTQTFANLEGYGRLSLITNPYVSPISWNSIYNDNSTNNSVSFENYYTYWDPNVGTRGGYITVNTDGIKSASTNDANLEIHTGQAFFIKAKSGINSPNFIIKEKNKFSNGSVYNSVTSSSEMFLTSLYFNDTKGKRILADATNEIFNNVYSTNVDANDAEEMANQDENIAIFRGGKMLSIEGRPIIDATDTLPLVIQNLKEQTYEWEFNPSKFKHSNLLAYLDDKFLHVRTPITLTTTSVIPFYVNTNLASAAPDRFRIVFTSEITTLPLTTIFLKAYHKAAGIQLEWITQSDNNIVRYEIEKCINEKDFTKTSTIYTVINNYLFFNYSWIDTNLQNGNNFYRIKIIYKSGDFKYSNIENIKISTVKSNFEFYPNPIKTNNITIKLNNCSAGIYTVKLMSLKGETISTQTISHTGGSASQTIFIKEYFPPGVYDLQIKGNNFFCNKIFLK